MNRKKGFDRYLKATVRLALFANDELHDVEERELDEWQDCLVELLERVNDQRFEGPLAPAEEPRALTEE